VKIPSAKQVGATAPKDNRRLRVLTPKESEDILSELEKCNIHAWRITKFAMLTGCRASEAFGLCWRDVNLEEKQVRFVDTKNKDDRYIPLTPAVANLLFSFGPGRPEEIVFTRSGNKPYTETPHSFRTVVEISGLNEGRTPRDRVSFHTIRHTVATQLAKYLDVRSLMDIMGWKVVAMAARYIHSNEDTKRAAMAALEKTLSPQEKGKVLPFPVQAG
jgi:integrase